MKWSPAGDGSAMWLLERRMLGSGNLTGRWGGHTERLAIVAKAERDLAGPAQYAANVVLERARMPWDDSWRQAPMLFYTLRHAQLWCEREVRLMEVGELM